MSRVPAAARAAVLALLLAVLVAAIGLPAAAGVGSAPAAPGRAVHQQGVYQQEVYRQVDGTDLHVVVQGPPDADGTAPAVVLVHGGGWESGSAEDMAPWAELLADAGWVAFSIDYRLSSQTRGSWPAAFEDVQAGVAWVHDNAARHGADPARMVVFGESAGGHLATLLAVEGTGGDAAPVAVAAWSAPLDLAPLVPPPGGGAVPACTGNDACQEFWSMGWAQWFLGCAPDACPRDYAAASPGGRAFGGADPVQAYGTTTPIWFANSTDELVPVAPAEAFAAELAAAGVDHELVTIPGKAHAHGYGQRVWNEMVAWLAERLGVEAPEPAPFPGDAGDRTGVLVPLLVAALGLVVVVALAAGRAERRRDEASASAGATTGPGGP